MPIHSSRDEQNIITLTFDSARSVNVIDADFLRELQENVSSLTNDTALQGVILTSAKSAFVVGADIDLLFDAVEPRASF